LNPSKRSTKETQLKIILPRRQTQYQCPAQFLTTKLEEPTFPEKIGFPDICKASPGTLESLHKYPKANIGPRIVPDLVKTTNPQVIKSPTLKDLRADQPLVID
jgi:hypothetical protein